MAKKEFIRSIIETALKKGINYVLDNPKRGVRNLLDLGEYFSSGRFQKTFFDIAHEILNNEDSFYYVLIEDLLKNTNHDTISTFGINMGYNSFTYGAEIIRKKEKKSDYKIPWIITFDFREFMDEHLSVDEIIDVIEEGKDYGIYSYMFILDNNDILKYLYPVFEKHEDCAFPIIIGPKIMNEEHSKNMNNMHNICFLVQIDQSLYDNEVELENCIHYLREEHFLYGIACYYNKANYKKILEDTEVSNTLRAMNANFTLLIQEHDGDNYNTKIAEIMLDEAYKSRFKTDSPAFIMDFYGDIDSVGNIISEDDNGSNIVSINSDGQVCSNFLGNKTSYNIRTCKLEDLLRVLST